MSILRRAGVAGTALALSAATAVVAAGPAAAASPSCASPKVANYPGYALMDGNYNLKKGMYAACDNVRLLKSGTKIYLWCIRSNSYGNTWAYVRVAGTQTYGWMSASNFIIQDGVSGECPR